MAEPETVVFHTHNGEAPSFLRGDGTSSSKASTNGDRKTKAAPKPLTIENDPGSLQVIEDDTLGGQKGLAGLFFQPFINLYRRPLEYKHVWWTTGAFILTEIVMGSAQVDLQWHWFPLYAWLLLCISPITYDPYSFFSGSLTRRSRDSYSILFLASSTFVSWIFAKSVYNASTLGYSYGVLGGFGYACYYTAFFSVGFIGYKLREQGYDSLAEAISDRYGVVATWGFGLALAYRLMNEIWSNSTVVASFYGPPGSGSWWAAAWLVTFIPMFYSLTGGLKASFLSDLLQTVLHVIFLIIVLGYISPGDGGQLGTHNLNWTMKGGVDFLLVALVQGMISYPYFDPVLTDRAFLAKPKTMFISFVIGGLAAGLFIVLFSFIGIYAHMHGLKDGTPATVSSYMGIGAFTVVNMLTMTSSMAVVDSTCASTSKLFGLELYGLLKHGKPLVYPQAKSEHMWVGRISIVVMCIIGTLPLLADPAALSATSISGTVVLGLGPPILALPWMKGNRPLAFHLPFWFGALLGIAYQIVSYRKQKIFESWKMGEGSYAELLGVNVYGLLIAIGLFVLGLAFNRGEEARVMVKEGHWKPNAPHASRPFDPELRTGFDAMAGRENQGQTQAQNEEEKQEDGEEGDEPSPTSQQMEAAFARPSKSTKTKTSSV